MNLLDSSSSARCGKIAGLPIHLRDQVNRRLENNEPAGAILPWLNSLAETKQLLAAHFGNAPVSPQNLSDWRQGGYREWLLRRELSQQAESLAESAAAIQGQAQPQAIVDNLALVLAARYAALLNNWDGAVTPEFENQLRVLRALNRDIVQLQNSLHRAVAQNAKLEAEKEVRREAEAEKERKQKVLPLIALDSYRWNTSFHRDDVARLKTAINHNLTLDEVARFCDLPSSQIVPNQAT